MTAWASYTEDMIRSRAEAAEAAKEEAAKSAHKKEIESLLSSFHRSRHAQNLAHATTVEQLSAAHSAEVAALQKLML